MNTYILFFAVFCNVLAVDAWDLRKAIRSILAQRRQNSMYGIPRRPEHLPMAEPIHPGHTLIRPSFSMLKSSIKYPLRASKSNLVYGNPDNLGITYGKTLNRLMYSGFRRSNDVKSQVMTIIVDALKKIQDLNNANRNPGLKNFLSGEQFKVSAENNGMEELDEDPFGIDYRRKKRYSSSEDLSASSDSSDYEKNPGNPFTVHKDRYKQNWPWNFAMDGDHMNINPLGPKFGMISPPSSSDLFFARKWWYFNQDDYKPFR